VPWALAAVALAVGAGAVAGFAISRSSSSSDAFPGFGSVAVTFEQGQRAVARKCALLAATEAQREKGLMNVRDLHGYSGMVFRFDSDTDAQFYMKDTPTPLSIAWFDSQGLFVSSTDMPPCPSDSMCPTYGASRPYRYAIEVPKGRLASLGIGSGSSVVFGESCSP
jgi:uncharacterized membrane protein (UPF0127 family)